GQDGRAIGDHRAMRLRLAEQAQHQIVAVDDAGGRRGESRDAAQLGLLAPDRLGIEEEEIGGTVGGGLGLDLMQQRNLLLGGGDDPFAGAAVAEAAARAVRIERLAAGDAERRLEAAGRIIEAGMDDLAVAARGAGADRFRRLEQHDLASGERQRAGRGEADDPRSYDDALDAVHGFARDNAEQALWGAVSLAVKLAASRSSALFRLRFFGLQYLVNAAGCRLVLTAEHAADRLTAGEHHLGGGDLGQVGAAGDDLGDLEIVERADDLDHLLAGQRQGTVHARENAPAPVLCRASADSAVRAAAGTRARP